MLDGLLELLLWSTPRSAYLFILLRQIECLLLHNQYQRFHLRMHITNDDTANEQLSSICSAHVFPAKNSVAVAAVHITDGVETGEQQSVLKFAKVHVFPAFPVQKRQAHFFDRCSYKQAEVFGQN